MKKLLIALALVAYTLQAWAVVPHGDADPERYMSIDVTGNCKGRDVTIKVTKYSGDALRDVDIDLFLMNRKVAYGKTDAKGEFTFKPDDAGSYKLSAKRSGYEDAEAVINISRNCGVVMTTTSTTTTSTSSTTILFTTTSTAASLTTSTTKQTCNYNRYCDIRNSENYLNCPSDCAGSADGYCDQASDGRCDPDCGRMADSDCMCNGDGRCERGYEDYVSCPKDCPTGSADGLCDQASDGRCDPDCNETSDAECKKIDYSGIILPAIAVIIIFGVIAALFTKREMKNIQTEKADDDLIDELIKRLKEGEDPQELRKELLSDGRALKLLEKAEERLWE